MAGRLHGRCRLGSLPCHKCALPCASTSAQAGWAESYSPRQPVVWLALKSACRELFSLNLMV